MILTELIHSYYLCQVTCLRPLVNSVYRKKYFSYFSTKTYVVGSQKNRLNELVLLSPQNICFRLWVRKHSQFYAPNTFKIVMHCSLNYSYLKSKIHNALLSTGSTQEDRSQHD